MQFQDRSAGDALRGYAICAEQRSGSSYLCQLLASTGMLGRPDEYFNGPGMATFTPGFPQDPDGQISAILQQGTTPNGVYGLKLFSDDFDRMAPSKWTQRLPNLHFVSLVRRDLLGQAISVTRLAQTDQYSADAKALAEPRYDPAHIACEIHRLALGQARWAAFFARCGIAPLHLDYEEISADARGTVEKLARFLGLEEHVAVDPGKIHTRVQRDTLSDEWRARFVAEARDVSYLDKLLPPSLPSRITKRISRYVQRLMP
jgi:LPS sulfotransferase NodH